MSDMLEIIKQAAVDAVGSMGVKIVFGMVEKPKPLQIRVHQKLTIDSDYIIKTTNIPGLEAGDVLVMLQEGSRFLIMGKVVK